MMEEVLRKVIQRKRAFFRKYLVLTRSQISHLKDLGLLSDSSFDTLTSGVTEPSSHAIIDHLLLMDQGQPDRFLHFLKTEMGWVWEEVTSELKAETLELDIDDHVMEEAASIIHRHFGRSRRFSERDKKMMTTLVATRSQVAKEVWKRRLAEVTRALEKVKVRVKVREDSIKIISDVMDTFLRQNQVELFDFSRDMKSTSQLLLETGCYGNQPDDLLADFLSKVTSMLDRFRRVLFEKESLVRQKRLCMKVLERNDFETPLDRMVLDKIDEFKTDRQMNEDMLEALNTRVATLDLELRQRDKTVARLRQEVVELRSVLDDPMRGQHPSQEVPQNVDFAGKKPNETEHKQNGEEHSRKQMTRLPLVRDTQTDKKVVLTPPEARMRLLRTPPVRKNASQMSVHPLKAKSANYGSTSSNGGSSY